MNSVEVDSDDNEPSNFEYAVAALAMAKEEGLTLNNIYATIEICGGVGDEEDIDLNLDGKDFDAGISAMVDLQDIWRKENGKDQEYTFELARRKLRLKD